MREAKPSQLAKENEIFREKKLSLILSLHLMLKSQEKKKLKFIARKVKLIRKKSFIAKVVQMN